uniref:Uncharacterized protein n=1 Tax=Oryza meridionalis TaxID=40149 RepID=A0A0E0EHJ2_9ORYZ
MSLPAYATPRHASHPHPPNPRRRRPESRPRRRSTTHHTHLQPARTQPHALGYTSSVVAPSRRLAEARLLQLLTRAGRPPWLLAPRRSMAEGGPTAPLLGRSSARVPVPSRPGRASIAIGFDNSFALKMGGAVTDLQETIDAIIKASDFPSPILVAGVGEVDRNGDNGTGKYVSSVIAIGAMFSMTHCLGSSAYLYISVAFAQMLKEIIAVFLLGAALGLEEMSCKMLAIMPVELTSALTARVTGIWRDWTVVLLSAAIFADTQLTFINIIGYLIGVVAYNNHKLKVKPQWNEQQEGLQVLAV